MKICVFTLGCRVNSYESDALVKKLRDMGHDVTGEGLTVADLYVINTCAVTGEAERKSAQCISRVKKMNKNARIIVCGCASQRSPDRFKKDGVIYISGTKNKLEIADNLERFGVSDLEIGESYEECEANSARAKAYIKIQDGCNNFCSYCIIPYLRGRSRSRRIEDAIREIQSSRAGETVITGINLSAYGKERGESLSDVLRALKDEDKRISLGSLSVGLITEEFLESAKGLKCFCPHFHISLQSGSNKVLHDMNRKYTREEYLRAVELIRKYFDNPSITTDIIVGYPTESENDFEDTLELARACKFSDIHIFPYSKREGTKAYSLGQLDGSIVSKRVGRLTVLRDELRKKYMQNTLYKPCSVLVEEQVDGNSVGYSERYVRVWLKGEYEEGEIVEVIPTKEYKDGVIAK